MKRKSEDAEKTRLSLIDAALSVFLRKGYADSTIENICTEAAMTRGAFYHYFDSKKSIYNALMEERLKPAQSLILEIVRSGLSALAKIKKLLEYSLILLKNDKGYRDVNELTLLKTGFAEELGEGMEAKKENMKAMVKTIENLLIKAVEDGEIQLKNDPHSSALHLYSSITGAGSLWLIDGDFFDFPDNSGKYADMWLEGIKKQ